VPKLFLGDKNSMSKEMFTKLEHEQVEQYYTQKPTKNEPLKPLFDIEN